MKILILSRNFQLYSTNRLLKAAQQRGHDTTVVDYLRCYMNIASHRPQVMFGGKPLEKVDAVIPRIGATHTFYGTAVVRQFEVMDVYPLNGSEAITRSRDKLRSMQLLSQKGIGLPVTALAHSTKDVAGVVESVGGAPLVVKLLEGTQGIGVVLCETKQAAESVMEAFRGLDAQILAQEFIQEAAGADIRCFVIGNEVVASMKRQARPGEFRSNLHRGGAASRVEISDEERSTAIRAANTMGLRVAGVDMLRSDHGPLVLEVNSSPGLEGIEAATGVDVAGRIVEHIEKHVAP